MNDIRNLSDLPRSDECPTLPLLIAGRLGFGMQRTATYKAVHDGTFPLEVIESGGRKFVRTRDFRELLRLDEPTAARA